MIIRFIGACRTVTGSQYLLELDGAKVLLECGLYQGHRAEAERINRTFAFKPRDIRCVILSHAHLDHSGNLPHLYNNGFTGRVFCTPATMDVTRHLLLDSAKIQEGDIEHLNKKLAAQNQPLKSPLYTVADAEAVLEQFTGNPYGVAFSPVKGMKVTFFDAGHILGSAVVLVETATQKLLFSGDLGRYHMPIIRDPVVVRGPHYIMLESTYGNRVHPTTQGVTENIRQIIQVAIDQHGRVVIPAFAVERTQILITILKELYDDGFLRDVPVYVDSPLAVNASDIFKMHPECFDDETNAFIKADKHHTALGFDRLIYTRSVEESKALNNRTDPMIIISASGMAETGRILHHLRNNIGNPKNTVLIVSWQAPDTLGRRLADREKKVRIFGEEYEVKAEVATIGGLSAHAGQDFLVEYALRVKGRAKQVFLSHGEPIPAEALSEKLVEAGMEKPFYPERGVSVEI